LPPEQEGAVMASASLSTREYGGHVVVALCGELDVVDAASVMAVLAAAAARDPRIIVDLAALEFIDCCALGRVRAQARQAPGQVDGGGRISRRRRSTIFTSVRPQFRELDLSWNRFVR
jgi:anti-anti-sigma factor